MKLYEKYLFISLFFISFIQTQDISGNYRLTGLSAVYYDFVRYETSITVNDNYGLSISIIGDVYSQGDVVGYDYQGPYDESYLNTEDVQLYVNFNTNGTAIIVEGVFDVMKLFSGFNLFFTIAEFLNFFNIFIAIYRDLSVELSSTNIML